MKKIIIPILILIIALLTLTGCAKQSVCGNNQLESGEQCDNSQCQEGSICENCQCQTIPQLPALPEE
jgi:hypothetical protein